MLSEIDYDNFKLQFCTTLGQWLNVFQWKKQNITFAKEKQNSKEEREEEEEEKLETLKHSMTPPFSG